MSRQRGRSPLQWCALALLLLAAAAQGEVPIPPLKSHVTDLTATLSADQRNTLEGELVSLESRKGSQVAVLMVPTVQPESIEQYATRAYDQWKLGRKGVDDGVLLVIAKNDRKLRIEVGYGLEGKIPDAIAKRIIDKNIVPHFKRGDFYGGIHAGTDRIVRLVAGEVLPAPKQVQRPASRADPMGQLFYGFIALVVGGGILRSIFGRLIGAGIAGIIAGAFAYFLIDLGAAVIAAIVVFVFTLIVEVQARSGGGWSSGGGSWSSGGGGFSGGGFSGGGGSSGGGGASGRW